VVAADDVPDEPAEPDEPEDPEVVPESVVTAGFGCWAEESVAEADDDPDVEPVLSEVLLGAVTVRVSAATTADELRDVL